MPQHPSFNAGEWSKFERRIRKYAEVCTKDGKGVLYLLSGTAFVFVDNLVRIDTKEQVKGVRKNISIEMRPGEKKAIKYMFLSHCGLLDVALILLLLIMLGKVLQ